MDGSGGNASNASNGQGQMKCPSPCLPTHPPLTSCCVAGFLTDHRGLGTPGLSNQTLDHIVCDLGKLFYSSVYHKKGIK